MTKQEVLETIEHLRGNFARLTHNKDKSDPTVRQVTEEFSEANRRYLDWEDRFLYRIGASAYHSAEVSFVGEETAHRCGWHVCRLPKKKALTGTDGAVATGIVDVPIRIGKQTLGLQLFVSPHTEDFLVLGRDVVSRVLVRDERLILTLNNGEVIDTLSDDPFGVIFEVTYLDENDGWRVGELEPENGAQETEVYKVMETSEIVQLSTPESGVASSIAIDLAYIQEEEDLQENEDVELRIWPTAINAQEAQSDGTVLEKERLIEYTSGRQTEEAVCAMGEVHFGNVESADRPTTPFPVLGVVAESTDELMTPPITIQLERNRPDLSPDWTDWKRTLAGAESMETAELKEFCPLVDCQLDTMKDNLHQITGSTSALVTESSGASAVENASGYTTESLEIQDAGSTEIQTAEKSEVAIITSSAVECTSAQYTPILVQSIRLLLLRIKVDNFP